MPPPNLIFKTNYNGRSGNDGVPLPSIADEPPSSFSPEQPNGDDDIDYSGPLDDDMMEAVAQCLAMQHQQISGEIDRAFAPLRQRITALAARVQQLEQRIAELHATTSLPGEVAELRGAMKMLVDKSAGGTTVEASEIVRKIHTESR